VKSWALAFALTHAVEVPIYLFLLRLVWRKRIAVAFGTSALTHPYLWFVLPSLLLPVAGYWGFVAIGESFVVLVEAGVCVLLGVPARRALFASCVANAASVCAGFLLLR
jgi:hypothetical protein